MRRPFFFLLTTIGLALLTFLAVRHTQFRAVASVGPNFLATAIERRFDLTGREVHAENLLRAVNDDGFVDIVQRKDPLGRQIELKFVVSYSSRKRIVVDPMTESTTTYSLTPKEIFFYKSQKPNCTDEANPQTATIAGYTTVRNALPIPDNASSVPRTWEQWLAPQLGCFPLRARSIVKDSGVTIMSRDVAFVVLGAPPAGLFEVPTTYTERSPAQVFAEYARRFPGSRGASDKTSQLLDGVYRNRQ